MAKSIEERIAASRQHVRESDPTFWRHALADATVSLLEEGVPVTIENLISRLEASEGSLDILVKGKSSKTAIEKLRQIVLAKD